MRELNLEQILLPHFSPECFDSGNENYSCDYPQDVLGKMISQKAADRFPDFSDFLEVFTYRDGRDQEELTYEFMYGATKDWNQIACNWLREDLNKSDSLFQKWKQSVDAKNLGQYWQGIQPYPVYTACQCGTDNKHEIVQYHTMASEVEGVTFTEDDNPCGDVPSSGQYISRWRNSNHETIILQRTDCNFVNVNSVIGVTILAIGFLANAILVVLGCLVFYYRNTQIMYASNRRTMVTFLSGALCLNLAAPVSVASSSPSGTQCFFRIVLITLGLSWFIGALLIKQYFLYGLFNPSSLTSKNTLRTRLLNNQMNIGLLLTIVLVTAWAFAVGIVPSW